MRKGSAHTAEARRKIGQAKRVPVADRVYRDAQQLYGAGLVDRYEFAVRVGVSPATAYARLRRLEKLGSASSWLHRGRRVFISVYAHDSVQFAYTRQEKEALDRKYAR
jgi:hypothetical protein